MQWNILEMPKAGIIDYSVSPWCHPTKFVLKKDGNLWMVHVYLPINAARVANSYPMRHIELVINSLMQPRLVVYFQADAANGYSAVPLAQEHAYKTAFSTHHGQYHYLLTMGQGPSRAPQMYLRLKDTLAGPILEPNKEPVLDQCDMCGGSFQYFINEDFGAHGTYHDQWTFLHQGYFPRLARGRFTLQPMKTGFYLEKINPLGFVLHSEGLRPSEEKILAIQDYPSPMNLDEVNWFRCMTTYLRRFTPG